MRAETFSGYSAAASRARDMPNRNIASLGAFLPGYCLTAATTSDSAPLATPTVPAAAKVPFLLTV
jgi:hypothetical protein